MRKSWDDGAKQESLVPGPVSGRAALFQAGRDRGFIDRAADHLLLHITRRKVWRLLWIDVRGIEDFAEVVRYEAPCFIEPLLENCRCPCVSVHGWSLRMQEDGTSAIAKREIHMVTIRVLNEFEFHGNFADDIGRCIAERLDDIGSKVFEDVFS